MTSYTLTPTANRAEVGEAGGQAPLMLADILDVELLNKMLQERYVYKSIHEQDDSYVLLCYTVLAQIHGRWNAATKLSRGLIVRRGKDDLSDAQVLERPWSKFFTLSQQESGWHLGDEENADSAEEAFAAIDFQAPADVFDKMDGSLGILYRDPEGLPAFATKGSFGSEQAKSYSRMLRENDELLEAANTLLERNQDTTSLFELVGPKNRIVLSYKETQAVLLGGSKKSSGASVNPEELVGWHSAGLPVVERMQAKNLSEALALPARQEREGVVVSIGGKNPMKIKIKQDDYTRLHRIVTMFSRKETRAVVMELSESATYADLLAIAESEDVAYFESIRKVLEIDGFSKGDEAFELIRERREGYFKEILIPRAKAVRKAKEVIDSLDESYFQGKDAAKNFAAIVKTLPADQSSLFPLYRARLNGNTMEELGAFHEIRKAVQDAKDRN